MSNTSGAFFQLDERIQRFLWAEQWEELRDVQELAIPQILPANQDVIVAAATAAGKTEAAFLPALTHLLQQTPQGLIVYISPLKALINDQFGRLDRLCEDLDVPVWPWHGDISATTKARFLRAPSGVLLITPESLEALLCNRGTAVASTFERTTFFVVDELHAFIGSERGKQLQSLMHRIETVLRRKIPRVGLSATLGDMQLAAQFLRADSKAAIVEAGPTGSTLKILAKGYEESLSSDASDGEEEAERAPVEIAKDLFQSLRGSNNLVFPNSRREVERYTHLLNDMCDQARVPNEFWPHHGNLSREIRTETEAALKQKERPATAICTSTLELGIDIGAVKSVGQIGPPPSVASLRQRLGRSGRRKGESAILRGYLIEDAIDDQASLATRLRLDTAQTAAAIVLLLEGWFEPPAARGAHLSTLVQQLMSAIAQYGSLNAGEAYRLLCGPSAPFDGITKEAFAECLRHLGQQEILTQDSSGVLLHGRVGDKLVNHYTFYAAFAADEEFRVVAGGKTLGTLPVDQMLIPGQRILFAGRTWLVEDVDDAHKTINVAPAKGGTPPLFNGSGGRVHTRVRQKMRSLYESDQALPFLDSAAQRFLDEGRAMYASLGLSERWCLDQGAQALLVTWLGDAANEAISCLLLSRGVRAVPTRLGVEVTRGARSLDEVLDLLVDISVDEVPPLNVLLADAKNLLRQKWDWSLSPDLLRMSYASLNLDMETATKWLREQADQGLNKRSLVLPY
jgi:ATP-dependent Lhr-like helicase